MWPWCEVGERAGVESEGCLLDVPEDVADLGPRLITWWVLMVVRSSAALGRPRSELSVSGLDHSESIRAEMCTMYGDSEIK